MGDGPFAFTIVGSPKAAHTNRLGRTPAWTKDDTEVQKVLLQIFPSNPPRWNLGPWNRAFRQAPLEVRLR